MDGWMSLLGHVCLHLFSCVRDRINFLTFICVYEGQTKIASVRESGSILMLSCVSFWQSPSAPRHCLHCMVKMSSRLLAVSWHFNTIRKSLQIREEQKDRHVRWTVRYALCHEGNIFNIFSSHRLLSCITNNWTEHNGHL